MADLFDVNIDKELGICAALTRAVKEGIITNEQRWTLLVELSRYLKSIGAHTGETNYPIKHKYLPAGEAFHNAVNLWDRRGNYGQLRWQCYVHLNTHLIEVLRSE